MSCYFIANIRIRDKEEYQKYLDRVDEAFELYKGEYLVVDENPELLEGIWDYTKSVVIRFDTKEDFRAWYNSPLYQEILKYRLAAGHSDTILAEGLN